MKIHQICSLFPMMSGDEFAGLKADIAANGQREPIWTFQGEVIDGRNRLKACEELGISPVVKEWDGRGSLTEFVVSLNLHRRHLSSGQRAACGTEIEERLAIEAKERQRASGGDRGNQHTKRPSPLRERIPEPPKPAERPRDQAAAIVGTNNRYIQDAKAVKAAAPDLHERVKNGDLTLPQAKRAVARNAKRTTLAAKAAALPDGDRRWEVIDGDCIEVLAKIPKRSVRLVFADPPYNIGINYGPHYDDDKPEAEFRDWCRTWLKAAARTLTLDGSMWVLINHEWAADFDFLLRDEVGLTIRNYITWYESFGVNCAGGFNRCSRRLFHAVRDPKRYVFNADAVTRESDRAAIYGDKRADPGGKIWDDVWGIKPPIPRLVDNATERIPDFPTQLPLGLLRAIVGCASDPGDIVLDPFNGSGTTGVACIELGRDYIGIEKSLQFARLSRQRLKVAQGASK